MKKSFQMQPTFYGYCMAWLLAFDVSDMNILCLWMHWQNALHFT